MQAPSTRIVQDPGAGPKAQAQQPPSTTVPVVPHRQSTMPIPDEDVASGDVPITSEDEPAEEDKEVHVTRITASTEYQLKKYLLLLATLVATVTYAAGLNLPGGSWLEDTPEAGQLAGDSILRKTNYRRYIVFYYFNAISFAASLLLGLLLLLSYLQKERGKEYLLLMWTVMLVDGFGLMGAYAAGISHDKFTTICASVLVSGVAIYAAFAFACYLKNHAHLSPMEKILFPSRSGADNSHQAQNHICGFQNNATPANTTKEGKEASRKKHEMLLVLAIFAATIAYVAGLNPPGGFWRSNEEGHHSAGDPVLQRLHPNRYKAFFFFNTTAFVTSLLAIMLVVNYEKLSQKPWMHTLCGIIVTSLLGLGGSYAVGSCRDGKHTGYIILLALAVVSYIYLQHRALIYLRDKALIKVSSGRMSKDLEKTREYKDLEKTREYIQLLATLAATVAYQAGLDPPGGVWAGNGEGHNVGDPILLTTYPLRYKVFFYFNSAALVASLVIVVMLQSATLVRGHALQAAIILDFFGLIGAYAAGSCRDTITTVSTVALAGGVFVYVVIQIVFCTLEPKKFSVKEERQLDKTREVLLLLAILAATLTYQAGLTPPGGLWEKDDSKLGHRAGFPVLEDQYPRRYKAFFYCNAASFMASVALIILLQNQDLYKPAIRCYALYVCMVAGMFGLMGAYAAGSSLHLKTSISFLAFVGAGFAIVAILAIIRWCRKDTRATPPERLGRDEDNNIPHKKDEDNKASTAGYLMLVGILAASVTYLTGLKPPGGMWRDDGDGHSAGNPVLYDTNKRRYNVFFYSNSTSFVASIIVIALLLLRMMLRPESEPFLSVAHTAILLDVLALLIAYAAGSAPAWHTSWKVILLIVPMVLLIGLLSLWKHKGVEEKSDGTVADLAHPI